MVAGDFRMSRTSATARCWTLCPLPSATSVVDDVVFRRTAGLAHGGDQILYLRLDLVVLGGRNIVVADKSVHRRIIAREHVDLVVAKRLTEERAIERVHPREIVRFRLLVCLPPNRLHPQLARQRKAVLGYDVDDGFTLVGEGDVVRLAAADDDGAEHHEKCRGRQQRDGYRCKCGCFLLGLVFHGRPGGCALQGR